MKAFTKSKYGGPEILQFEEVEKPALKDDHILIKVLVNSVNPADWHTLRGKPLFARFSFGLFKPKDKILGADFAGIVEEAGENVEQFKIGDRVFGETLEGGAFAEFICVPANVCAVMPEETDFTEMACVPIAGLTALQALITHGQLKEGESVFINGSSGGVGHFAVQIAKAYGANVTAVCSDKNVDFVKVLGADRVIAYDKENIHQHDGKYNLVIDTHGNLSHKDFKRMGQRGVMVGFTTVGHMISVLLKNTFSKFPLALFTAQANTKDLETLATLIQDRKINVHIEKTYLYKEIPEAISYIEAMRTKGKVAMAWERIDKASRLVHASPHVVYAAFAAQRALQTWLPPGDMDGKVTAFEFREGGGYRMRLMYTTAEHTAGKTTEHSDEVMVRFIRLVPNERIEQAVTFDSEQEEFAGEMKMTWTFEERDSDTLVTVSCTNVPEGIRPEDHEVGLASSLGNLAEFVEE